MIAGLKGLNGQLEFISADDLEVLNAAEHFLATEIEWDPTGRYVATAVTAMQQMENGLNMWLFNGQLLYRYPFKCMGIVLSFCIQRRLSLTGPSNKVYITSKKPRLSIVGSSDKKYVKLEEAI